MAQEGVLRPELKIKLLPLQTLFNNFINFSTHSLIEYIKKECEENPFLIFDFDEKIFEEIPQNLSIKEELIQQLHLLNIPKELIDIGEFIIFNLEDNGYFKMDLMEVSEILNVKYERVEDALRIIQNLEPPGIGARNLKECLLIQAKKIYNDKILEEIIEKNWDFLKKRKFKDICKNLKIDEKTLNEKMEKLKKLNPNPLNLNNQSVRRIIPEGEIKKEGEKLKVYINDRILPYLHLDSLYEKYLNSALISERERKFLERKIKRAKIIIEMIEKRRKFLERVFDAIVNYQKEFFENGNLLPLKEKDLAEKMNVSISTISRAINGKYLIYNNRLLRIKELFVPEFKYSISRNFVLKKIKEIIEKEEKPLSDSEIANKLGWYGIKISRRTVNKYRNQLKILNSYLR